MKNILFTTIAASYLLFSSLTFFTGCYSGDMAIVTIKLERNDLALENQYKPKPLIDRILEFFSFPVYAGTPWNENIGTLSLTISASDYEKSIEIPNGATSFSIEVPAGNNRTFSVISNIGAFGNNWGGRATVSLTAGQETSIAIKMMPMIRIDSSYTPSQQFSIPINVYVTFLNEVNIPSNVSNLLLYRSNNIQGPYTLVGTYEPLINMMEVADIIPYGIYYYIVNLTGSDGEGIPSDPYAIEYRSVK